METTTMHPGPLKRGVFGVILLTACLAGPQGAGAEVINSCITYCHSLPPNDGPRTGSTVAPPTTASFLGNHQTHATASAASCAKCHPGSAAYSFGHMTAASKPVVKIGSNINTSPAGGQYLKSGGAVVFFN